MKVIGKPKLYWYVMILVPREVIVSIRYRLTLPFNKAGL